jgi:hypothetical protein
MPARQVGPYRVRNARPVSAQEKLVDLLGFYLKQAYQAAGLPWDSDNWTEVNNMVDLIATIATDESHQAIAQSVTEEARR